jgi:membrane-associated protein
MGEFFSLLYTLLRHPGETQGWEAMIAHIGPTSIYVLMFVIIFCETGLVILPFLPGDSLLFALGAIGSQGIGINWKLASGLLIIAAILGDNLNYWVGRKVGPTIFRKDLDSSSTAKPPLLARMLNRKHLEKTERFFARHGGKAVILGRFVVVVRTCMPFVAGMGRMNYGRFLLFSVIGAFLWIGICVGAGVWLGQYEFIRKNFELVIFLIIGVTVVPATIKILWTILVAQRAKRAQLAEKPN